MAGHTTTPYKKTLSGSLGAGMGSLLSPGGRKYYILEHKITSKYHKAGEAQEIIVDNIEIGRDSHCQVRFDESFSTVSRHHAAIVKDGDGWKLVQISKTNSTLLNGRPVKTEWYLQNGDEIQLSVNGPKLGFIVPTGKKSTVASIGLTRRLSLFRQQALRPYKTAISILSCVLVLAVGGLVAWNVSLREDLVQQSKLIAKQIEDAKQDKALIDSLYTELVSLHGELDETKVALDKSEKQIEDIRHKVTVNVAAKTSSGEISATFGDTYLVVCQYMYNGYALDYYSLGTGFLLNNGYFVTAQHVVQRYAVETKITEDNERVIDSESQLNYINEYYHAGEIDVVMSCYSSTDEFHITYNYKNMPFTVGRSETHDISFEDEEGVTHMVKCYSFGDQDWAYIKMKKSGSLEYDAALSKSLPVQTKLTLVGFPAGQEVTTNGSISPIVTEALTSRQGLEDDGTIMTSNDNTDHGNSGGPVYVNKDGKFFVVGIMSSYVSGVASSKGRVVPIGSVFR